MSGFSAEWLALREPYDRARAQRRRARRGRRRTSPAQASIAVVDLACGTGATLRAIGAHLPPRQNWRLVDNDLSLLARASALGEPPRVTVTARPVDLARDLELALDGPLDLVTTSALLDLVSAEWLDRLIVEAAARRLPVYAALSYDGRAVFEPGDAVRCRDRGRLQRAPAHRQGLRSGARAGRAGARASSASSVSAIRSCRAAPIGCSARTIAKSRTTLLASFADVGAR